MATYIVKVTYTFRVIVSITFWRSPKQHAWEESRLRHVVQHEHFPLWYWCHHLHWLIRSTCSNGGR